MSATDELRKLLDERGVEYEAECIDSSNYFTWGENDCYSYTEYPDGTVLRIWDCTPEQAIAATLGGEDKSRWHELFGTPERAARAMVDMCEGGTFDDCGGCPAALYECKLGDYDALLEWLRGDAE